MSIYDTLKSKTKRGSLTYRRPSSYTGRRVRKDKGPDHRIAYLIDECGVNPWNIMAITFYQ